MTFAGVSAGGSTSSWSNWFGGSSSNSNISKPIRSELTEREPHIYQGITNSMKIQRGGSTNPSISKERITIQMNNGNTYQVCFIEGIINFYFNDFEIDKNKEKVTFYCYDFLGGAGYNQTPSKILTLNLKDLFDAFWYQTKDPIGTPTKIGDETYQLFLEGFISAKISEIK